MLFNLCENKTHLTDKKQIAKPFILVIDSLGGKCERKVKIIQEYIFENVQSQSNIKSYLHSIDLPVVYP